MIFLHNTLSRQRERFAPANPEHIRLYVCGPTVYDRAHIGNARTFLIYDVLVRLLRTHFPRVTYVRNITDVDDKINARAAATGEPIATLTAQTTAAFHADMAALDILPPDIEPTATAHIADMIALIENLIAANHAYTAANHVLFAVDSFPQYGQLSGHSPDELRAGARIDVAPYKRDPGDFVLWKPSDPTLPGWPSPWGRGRPGWHIECSAMAWRHLGESFDIHGGGHDLLFPHHENERAQSLCALPGSSFARVWLHNGMLRLNGEKMSKSLGNVLTIPDMLARAPAEAIRLALLQTHYRSELDLTDQGLADAQRAIGRFYRALQTAGAAEPTIDAELMAALADDLNTPLAIARLHALADAALAGDKLAGGALRGSARLLGLLQRPPQAWFQGAGNATAIETAIADRLAARARRDFAAADAIRARLLADGIVLEDGATGTIWRKQ